MTPQIRQRYPRRPAIVHQVGCPSGVPAVPACWFVLVSTRPVFGHCSAVAKRAKMSFPRPWRIPVPSCDADKAAAPESSMQENDTENITEYSRADRFKTVQWGRD